MARTIEAAGRTTGAREKKRADLGSYLTYGALVLYAVVLVIAADLVFTWQYSRRLVSSAKVMASILPAADVAALSGKPTDIEKPEFQRLRKTLSDFILSDPSIKYAYLFALADGKEVAYLCAPEGPDEVAAWPGTVLGTSDPREDRFFAGGGSIVFPPYTDPWGTWVSVAVPLARDPATGRVSVAFGFDVAVKSWYGQILAFVAVLMGVLSVGAFLVWLAMDRMRRLRIQAERRAEADRAKKLEAEASERAERDFLALMSHEIRNPLSAVVGFSRLLAETRLDPEQRDHVDMLRASSDHLMDLVNDILDFSKIEAGRMEIVAQPFSPARLASDVVTLFSLQALRKGLDLRLEASPDCPAYLSGDAVRVRQVLVNLVSNAVKFTETGHVAIRLGYSPFAASGNVSIVVEDTGPGMDAATLAGLFHPFKQGGVGRDKGGTGLGLVISKSLVELMGGWISAGSDPGKGSVFTVELPLPPCEPPPAELEELDVPLSGLRVLVADDDPANRALVAALLERRGAKVVSVADGSEALAVLLAGLHTKSLDSAVLDRSMPGKSGLEIARALRAAEASSSGRLTLVALTGSITKEGAEECLNAGFDVVLPKPFDPDRLAEALLPATSGRPRAEVDGVSRSAGEAAIEPWDAGTDSAASAQGADSPAATTAAALIDREALLKRVEGDADLAAVLSGSFAETLSGALLSLRSALDSGDLALAARTAHKLRGSALNACAAAAVADRSGEIEAAAIAGELGRAKAALGRLVEACKVPIGA